MDCVAGLRLGDESSENFADLFNSPLQSVRAVRVRGLE